MIEKIIHFIWIDFKDELNKNTIIPKKYIDNIESCRKLNPDFEIKIWNGYDCYFFVKKYFPEYFDMYNNLKYPIQKCDIVRLMIVYIYGGIYSDVDRICIKSYNFLLDKYSKYNVILGKHKNYPNIFNDPIICTKNNDFIYYCIKNIKIYNLGIRYFDIFLSTGPFFITKQYYTYKKKDDIIILDNELNPCNLCNCSLDIKDSITFTGYDNNWLDKNGYESIIKFIYCKLNLIFIIVLLICFFIFLYILNKNNYFKKTKKTR